MPKSCCLHCCRPALFSIIDNAGSLGGCSLLPITHPTRPVQDFVALKEKYGDKGLVIMAFPCNQVCGAANWAKPCTSCVRACRSKAPNQPPSATRRGRLPPAHPGRSLASRSRAPTRRSRSLPPTAASRVGGMGESGLSRTRLGQVSSVDRLGSGQDGSDCSFTCGRCARRQVGRTPSTFPLPSRLCRRAWPDLVCCAGACLSQARARC